MFRIDFGWCMIENVKEPLMSVLLRAWAQANVRSLNSCVCNPVFVYAGLFLRSCIRGFWPVYTRSYMHTWALTRIREMPSRGLTLPFFTSILTILLLYAILTPLFVNFVFEHPYILLFIFILLSKISFFFFIIFNWIKNLMSFPFLQSSSPYAGRGSTYQVVE